MAKPSSKNRTPALRERTLDSKKHTPTAHSRTPSSEKRTPGSKNRTTGAKHRTNKFFVFGRKLRRRWRKIAKRVKDFRARHLHLHKSFRRSYREDYLRKTNTPGLLSHAMGSFRIIFRHWKTFLPFIFLMTILYSVLVGLMDETIYQQFRTSIEENAAEFTTSGQIGNFAKAGLVLIATISSGGLNTTKDDAQFFFMIILFLTIWLVTLYLLRYIYAGHKLKLRDALYNAMSPLISTLLMLCWIFIQALPIMFVVIAYSAALSTDFLATPFYALVFFIFAAVMILLSCYLLTGSLMGLIAVTTPGMYPMHAFFAASDLVAGRRIRIVLRVIFLCIIIALIYMIVMLPLIMLDFWLKSIWGWIASVPIIPYCMTALTCFVFIYTTVYFYRYYRWLLDYDEKQEKLEKRPKRKRVSNG